MNKLILPVLAFVFIVLPVRNVSAATVYSGSYTGGLTVPENGAIVENADISNSGSGVCLKITGDNVTVRNSKIHNCQDHGVQFLGVNGGLIENSEIYRAAMKDKPNTTSGGWPSLLKVQSVDESSSGLSQNIIIRNNYIHEGYGECMGLRGSRITVTGNTVKDCYSIGIYSNSDHTLVERNFVQCTGNPEFNRDGNPMVGIGYAEETFANWGAHGHDTQTVINNIITGCKYGVRYGNSDNGKGMTDTVIAFNTINKTTSTAISITYYSSQSNLTIHNNIASSVSANSNGASIAGNVSYSFPSSGRTSDFALSSSLAAQGSYKVQTDFFGKTRTSPYDAGAVEYGASTPVTSPTPGLLQGDITGPNGNPDRRVDIYDYNLLVTDFGKPANERSLLSDITGPNGEPDGKVDIYDYNIIITNFSKTN